jgi:5-methyltetrahydropteroyltriglutamate--homocysteine methyltransferase
MKRTAIQIPPLEATVIGSWSIPGWYDAYSESVRREPHRFGTVDREEAVHDAVLAVVNDQISAGLERITDGEVQRVDFNLGFYEHIHGLKRLDQGRFWGAPGHDQRSKYEAVSELTAPEGLGCVSEFLRFRRIVPDSPTKMPVPGPFTLSGCIAGGSVYPDREAVTEALLPIVRKELLDLVAAGVDFIQLDEPSFACHPQEADYFLDVIGRTVADIPAYISMHMCFGNYRARAVGWRSYAPIFPAVEKVPIDQLALEFASREMAEIEILARLPETIDVAVGLVDVKNTWVEPVGLIVDRIHQVLEYVPPQRVSVTPDCGFSQTPRHVAVAKAANMAEAVRQVRTTRGLA